jgi:selenocysteine lyase/cysteine desulfurase
MSLDRKTFLRRLGAGALGLAAAGAVRAEVGGGAPVPPSSWPAIDPARPEAFWRAVRGLFPLRAEPVYLNTGGLGPASQPVLDRVEAVTRELQEKSETGHDLLAPSRETVVRFLGVHPEELCFTRNATEANSIIAAGLALAPGDEVIFETHAHPGGSFPWLNQAKQRGVVVRLFEPDHGSAEANLARIRELLSPRTKVIQVSHITCTTGLVLPVAAIAELARARGLWFHIDGAQSVGMLPLDLAAVGCDSYAFSGHKWLGGPHETGGLFIRRDRLEAVAPTGIGAYSGELPSLPGEIKYFGAASRHEYGTRNAGLIAGLAEAVRLQEHLGRDRIAAHGRELAALVADGLAGVAGITVLTPKAAELRASITTFRHERADAGKLFGYLLDRHGLRCRPVTEQGLQAVRVSAHVFNSRAEAGRVVAAVRAAARDL